MKLFELFNKTNQEIEKDQSHHKYSFQTSSGYSYAVVYFVRRGRQKTVSVDLHRTLSPNWGLKSRPKKENVFEFYSVLVNRILPDILETEKPDILNLSSDTNKRGKLYLSLARKMIKKRNLPYHIDPSSSVLNVKLIRT